MVRSGVHSSPHLTATIRVKLSVFPIGTTPPQATRRLLQGIIGAPHIVRLRPLPVRPEVTPHGGTFVCVREGRQAIGLPPCVMREAMRPIAGGLMPTMADVFSAVSVMTSSTAAMLIGSGALSSVITSDTSRIAFKTCRKTGKLVRKPP